MTMNWATRVGFNGTSGSAATTEFEFLSCSVGNDEELIGGDGILGSRSVHHASKAKGIERPGGELVIRARPSTLDLLLPEILGANESADVFAIADTLQNFGLDVEKGGDAFRYAGCYVNRATFRSSAGGFLEIALDILAKTETGGISFPDILSTLSEEQPYVHHQGVLTLNSVTYEYNNLEIIVDNQLDGEAFFNSKTRTDIDPQGRLVSVNCDVKYTSTENDALYDLAIAGIDGDVTFTNGNYSCIFAFAKLQTSKKPVPISGKQGRMTYRLQLEANKDYDTPTNEIIVTNDADGAS